MKKLFIYCLVFTFSSIWGQDRTNPYLKHNIHFKPFNANSVGVGIGFNYERYLDSTNNFSLVLPIDLSFELTQTNWTGSQFGINTNPGIRFYFVEPRNFNWYMGTSIIVGHSSESSYGYFYNTSINQDTISITRDHIGSYVNTGFKGTLKGRLTYGLEIGLGLKIFDRYSQKVNGLAVSNTYNPNSIVLGNINASFGYKF